MILRNSLYWKCMRIMTNRKKVQQKDGLIGSGGVAAYLHSSLNYKILYTWITYDINKPDFLILEICINKFVLLLSIVHRRPCGATLDNYGGVLSDLLSVKECSHILIMGDFNYDISDYVKGCNHPPGVAYNNEFLRRPNYLNSSLERGYRALERQSSKNNIKVAPLK